MTWYAGTLLIHTDMTSNAGRMNRPPDITSRDGKVISPSDMTLNTWPISEFATWHDIKYFTGQYTTWHELKGFTNQQKVSWTEWRLQITWHADGMSNWAGDWMVNSADGALMAWESYEKREKLEKNSTDNAWIVWKAKEKREKENTQPTEKWRKEKGKNRSRGCNSGKVRKRWGKLGRRGYDGVEKWGMGRKRRQAKNEAMIRRKVGKS